MGTEPHETHDGHRKEGDFSFSSKTLHYGLIVLVSLVLAYNQFAIGGMQAQAASVSGSVTQLSAQLAVLPAAPATQASSSGTQTGSQQVATAGGPDLNALVAKVIPTGVPAVYGAELGITFDDPVKAFGVLGKLDDGNGLSDAKQNERYVKIGSMISCEYCCGADTLVFPGGKAACACAHSYAMRGLLKYLITKHPDMTDAQMLEEVAKVKTLAFPQDSVKKAALLEANGIELTQANIGSNLYRGGKGLQSSGGSTAANLPSQVGGC